MKIEIGDKEINTAIIAYVNTLGLDTANKDVQVKITAGRKDKGNSAEIHISNLEENQGKVDTNQNISTSNNDITDSSSNDDDTLFQN